VHHRTYEQLGQELVDDVITLCMECHLAVTDRERRRHPTFPVYPLDDMPPCDEASCSVTERGGIP
jgi:hypothetical protein